MITNHGIHQWQVVSGLPDTGGQNVYVNQLSEVLSAFGFKITIANRGGYKDPRSGEERVGFRYKNEHMRILYLEDSTKDFVRKEDMKEQIPELVDFLYRVLDQEGRDIELMVSHYWDAALLGVELNQKLSQPRPHLWIPHSLGAVKKRNMPPETWEKLRVDERIATERSFIDQLDYVAATSSLIRDSLEKDYQRSSKLFLPPCVDTSRFYPHQVSPRSELWDFLSSRSGIDRNELQESRFITEISRTDQTKRKDLLIRAFAEVKKRHSDIKLIISIEESVEELYEELTKLIRDLGVENSVLVIGHEAERLPDIYAISSIYCSPSVMEGFGMSVQEAAAEAVPVVGSDKIPFVLEYLLTEDYAEIPVDYAEKESESGKLLVGQGGIVAPSDNREAFVQALSILLEDPQLARQMGQQALRITVPYFTWEEMTRRLLEAMGIEYGE